MIEISPIIYHPLLVNTYVVYDKETLETLIIDPAGSSESIIKIRDKLSLKPKLILYTHLHLDHIAGGCELADQLTVPAYAHEKDMFLFDSLEQTANFLGYPPITPPQIDGFFSDGDEYEIGNVPIKVLHTPGHTPGGVCFLIENHLFSGDTLFRESIGRTDLWGGNKEDLISSIKNKIFTLPDEYIVHPGHGEYSSIKHEKGKNPFVRT